MKGLIYTIISVFLVASILVILFTFMSLNKSLQNDMTDKILSDQIHTFEKNVEDDIERAIFITGKRALIAASTNVSKTGITLTNPNAPTELAKLMSDGTLRNSPNPYMANNTLADWSRATNSIATESNFDLTFTMANPRVYAYDSFDIEVIVDVTLNITERTGRIRIEKSFAKSVVIPIDSLAEPLTSKRTNGVYYPSIIRCPYDNVHDVTNVTNDAKYSYFHSNKNGPSFLDRLENRLNNNYPSLHGYDTGLEYFFNPNKLINQPSAPTPDGSLTWVDYLYWSNTPGSTVCGIGLVETSDIFSFKIDATSNAFYQLQFPPC